VDVVVVVQVDLDGDGDLNVVDRPLSIGLFLVESPCTGGPSST
jgi:hypothetical protein